MAAHVLEPVPEVVKENLHNNLPLKFMILFLLCVVMHGSELNMNRAVICMLVALLLMVLFEYWRHIDKEREVTKPATENMWARDPYGKVAATYPAEPPNADVDMGIPPYPNQAAHESPPLSREAFGSDPYNRGDLTTYPGQAPQTDVDMGIPPMDAIQYTTIF